MTRRSPKFPMSWSGLVSRFDASYRVNLIASFSLRRNCPRRIERSSLPIILPTQGLLVTSAAVFWDVTLWGGTLRDIPKKAAEETK